MTLLSEQGVQESVGLEILRPLGDFDIRSIVVYVIMAIAALAAIASAYFLEGEVSLLFFVAFLCLTAGLWISQVVHSLGNAFTNDD